MNHLRHSQSIDFPYEVETAQAQKVQKLAAEGASLPLVPADFVFRVLSLFWADNFDTEIDSENGGSSVNGVSGDG